MLPSHQVGPASQILVSSEGWICSWPKNSDGSNSASMKKTSLEQTLRAIETAGYGFKNGINNM